MIIIDSFTQPIHLNTLIYSETVVFFRQWFYRQSYYHQWFAHSTDLLKYTDSFKKETRYELVVNPICWNALIILGIKQVMSKSFMHHDASTDLLCARNVPEHYVPVLEDESSDTLHSGHTQNGFEVFIDYDWWTNRYFKYTVSFKTPLLWVALRCIAVDSALALYGTISIDKYKDSNCQ